MKIIKWLFWGFIVNVLIFVGFKVLETKFGIVVDSARDWQLIGGAAWFGANFPYRSKQP